MVPSTQTPSISSVCGMSQSPRCSASRRPLTKSTAAAPIAAPTLDHDTPGRTLHAVGYDGWVVIEMKQGDGDGLDQVATAIDYARTHYIRA